MKSKIPLPSQRATPSLIPLPTKCEERKKLPLQTKNVIVPHKPSSAKQVFERSAVSAKSSVVSKKENKNLQRCPSANLPDSKKVSSLKNKSNANKVIPLQAKLVKQTGKVFAPVTKPTKVDTKEAICENKSKRSASFKSQERKISVPQGVKRIPGKHDIKSKVNNQSLKSTKRPTDFMQKNMNALEKNCEKIAVVLPIKQANLAAESGVDDSEFKNSCFFKNMILSEKEGLSPGLIKKYSEAKLNPEGLSCPKTLSVQSAEDFVAEVKRVSAKYHRVNGRLVPIATNLIHPPKLSTGFIEEVRRFSERFSHGNQKMFQSPHPARVCPTFTKMPTNLISMKENLNGEEVRRLSEIRTKTHQSVDYFLGSRRWTGNMVGQPSIAGIAASEVAAELRRVSEIRRQSGTQLGKKANFWDDYYSAKTPRQEMVKDFESPRLKETLRSKKKVTFLLPASSLTDLQPSTTEATKGKLSDISEKSSQNSTPEINMDCSQKSNDPKLSTTPELDLPPYKYSVDLTSNWQHSEINNEKSSINITQQFSPKSKVHLKTLPKSDRLTTRFSSLTVKNNGFNFKNNKARDIKKSLFPTEDFDSKASEHRGSFLANRKSISYDNLFDIIPTSSLFQSFQKLTAPSGALNNTEKFSVDETDESCVNKIGTSDVNETGKFDVNRIVTFDVVRTEKFDVNRTGKFDINGTGKFAVNTGQKIFTPHPVSFRPESRETSSVSPFFLTGKFSTMSSSAPIRTPLAMRNQVESPKVTLKSVSQRLDFDEPKLLFDRRESQIILQAIPTNQKMNDCLCDQECLIIASQFSENETHPRFLLNPIANTLNYGDEMHFIPVNSP